MGETMERPRRQCVQRVDLLRGPADDSDLMRGLFFLLDDATTLTCASAASEDRRRCAVLGHAIAKIGNADAMETARSIPAKESTCDGVTKVCGEWQHPPVLRRGDVKARLAVNDQNEHRSLLIATCRMAQDS